MVDGKRSHSPARPVRVLHLMTGPSSEIGGIASVIRDIQYMAEARGSFSAETYWQGDHQTNSHWKLRIGHRLNRAFSKFQRSPYRFSGFDRHAIPPGTSEQYDVLHLHRPEFQRAVAYRSHPRGAVIVHAHSINGFTGGCVLESECPRLKHGCRKCPVVVNSAAVLPPLGLRQRIERFRRMTPVIISNSHYTQRCIEQSPVIEFARSSVIITPAIDTSVFRRASGPRRASSVRRIGFVAASLSDENKQFDHFVDASRALKSMFDVELHAAGHASTEFQKAFPDVHFRGPVRGADLRIFYQSLDALVVSSRSESFGMISVESQFCGTPVVVYATGGLVETILVGVTGRLARAGDIQDLSNAIRDILSDKQISSKFDSPCVEAFLNSFTLDTIARRYEELYHDLADNPF